ncbi:MAG: 3'-5' exonuclease, partial [Patescibacteria group bacterium]
PHISSLDDTRELEEERRLFYVAATRAERVVYLLSAGERRRYDRRLPCLLSRFVEEIPAELLDVRDEGVRRYARRWEEQVPARDSPALGEAFPEVKVDRADEGGKWVQLAIAQSGVTYLTENSPAFDPMKFYGKSRADIEAYVRGIPGVQDVSVKFRPAWSDVAPRVPEHIEVRVVGE